MNRTPSTIRTLKSGVEVKVTRLDIPLALYEEIEALAEKETRNVQRQILHLLKQAITPTNGERTS